VALEDLWYIRNHKVRAGMSNVSIAEPKDSFKSVQLTGLTTMELNHLRPFFSESLTLFAVLNKRAINTPTQPLTTTGKNFNKRRK